MENSHGPATCIQPKPSMSDEISIRSNEKETWFSDMTQNGGFPLTYKADSNQITFLQMLSSRVSQKITYHCSNSVAYNHARRGHKRKSLTLMSWNDLEIRWRGKFKYEVPLDECQVRTLPKLNQCFRKELMLQFHFRMRRRNGARPNLLLTTTNLLVSQLSM